MDFKIAGTKEGITAFQLDVKLKWVGDQRFDQIKFDQIKLDLIEYSQLLASP